MQWWWSSWYICDSVSHWIPVFSSPSGQTGNSIASGRIWRYHPVAVPNVTHCPQSEILTCNFRGWVSERISELTQSWGVLLSDENKAGWSTGSLALSLFTTKGHLCGLRFQKGKHHLVDVVTIWEPSKPSWPWLCVCVCVCVCEREREREREWERNDENVCLWPDCGRDTEKRVLKPFAWWVLLQKSLVVESKCWIQTSTSNLYYLLFGKFKLIHWRNRKNCSESEITCGWTLNRHSLVYLESLDSSWNAKGHWGSPGGIAKAISERLKFGTRQNLLISQ